jgi:hypothetical protein
MYHAATPAEEVLKEILLVHFDGDRPKMRKLGVEVCREDVHKTN